MKKREFTFMNVVLCLLVIFIHISSEPISTLNRNSPQYAAVYAPWRLCHFVVQGFIFISAAKLALATEKGFNYPRFIKSRISKILAPYIISVFLYYINFINWGYFGFSLKDFIRYLALGNLVSHFYFIIIIFQFYLLMPVWLKLEEKISPFVALPFSLLITVIANESFPRILGVFGAEGFQYNDRLFTTYLFYWVSGFYLGKNYTVAKKSVTSDATVVLAFASIFALANAYFGLGASKGAFYVDFLERIQTTYIVAAITALYILACKTKEINNVVFKAVNRYSFYIYIAHPYLVFFIDRRLTSFGVNDIAARFFVRAVFVYAAAIICALIIYGLSDARKKRLTAKQTN